MSRIRVSERLIKFLVIAKHMGKQTPMTYRGIEYAVGETVRIFTGNADGSTPTLDGETVFHADRLRKLKAGLLSGELNSKKYHEEYGRSDRCS